MIQTIFGIILLVAPFLLLESYNDKRVGLATVFIGVLAWHLTVALITQALQLFVYPVIIALNFILFIWVMWRVEWNHIFSYQKNFWRRIDWGIIFLMVISIVYLWSVHFSYSGKYTIDSTNVYQSADKLAYPYPYYSDEWYAVALIKESLLTKSLPLTNPLINTVTFLPNLEAAFHSVLAELFLLLQLDPLVHYSDFLIASSSLIILLTYLLLGLNGLSRLSSVIVSLLLLYLVNGVNLPGLWYLIPLSSSLVCLLLSLIFFATDNYRLALGSGFLMTLFYFPLILFYLPILLFYLIQARQLSSWERRAIIYIFFNLTIIAAMTLTLFAFSMLQSVIVSLLIFFSGWSYLLLSSFGREVRLARIIKFSQYLLILFALRFIYALVTDGFSWLEVITSHLWYETFTPNYLPSYYIYTIIPLPIIFLSLAGLFIKLKNKLLLPPILVGLFFWFIYSNLQFRFFIEYQRVVVVTAILITIFSGVSLADWLNRLLKLIPKDKIKYLRMMEIFLLSLFLILYPNYTKRENWRELTLTNVMSEKIYQPAAPANEYLKADDLRIFAKLSEEKFLSTQWKGLVLGVATNNYPLATKPGTIAINSFLPQQFQKANCADKKGLAIEYSFDYVYLPKFDCEGFTYIDSSTEGYALYKID